MAYHFLTNQTPYSWPDCVGRLVRTLCSAGWQQIAFSDGTSVNNTPFLNPYPYSAYSNSLGTQTDSSANWGGQRAWIVLQQPPIPPSGVTGSYAGTRQICFQNNVNGDHRQWRIKYSFSGAYTNPATAGTAQNTPVQNGAINDEVYICGGGTDSSPSFDWLFYNGTEGGAHMHYVADDGAFSSGLCRSPYGFIMWGYTAGGANNVEDVLMFDPMLTGSFVDPGDADPFVWYRDNYQINGGGPFRSGFPGGGAWQDQTRNGSPLCWWQKNRSSQQFLSLAACQWGMVINGGYNTVHPGGCGQNVHTSEDDQIPILMARSPNQYGGMGYKGMSSFVNGNSGIHSLGATLSIVSPRDRFVVREFTLPWDGSIPVV
ncbi:MAG: hypothetical protein JO270_18285 [Acidobacteriaceae bacterium]|nr:hypothetical protein [Acidobacteriaceae bacterium]